MDRPTVFISYCHQDEAWKERLVQQLRILESEGEFEVWEDRRIAAGDDWLAGIQEAITRARVAVLLVSAAFLASRFIREEEIPEILRRRQANGLRVIPLILSPCAWQEVGWLAKLQCRPGDGRPLSGVTDHQAETALAELALEVRRLLRPAQDLPAVAPLPPAPGDISISRLPVTSEIFVGREAELARLDAAWESPTVRIFSLVGFGGMGKSAVVGEWLGRLAEAGWRGAERVFGWSFYSQGSEGRVSSADPFAEAALWWFGYRGKPILSPWQKGVTLARLVQVQRTLLVLDGLEPLQHSPGPQTGRLKDPILKALIRELSLSNPGLCIVTTRLEVADLSGRRGVERQTLEELSPDMGAGLLRRSGVDGPQAELQRASEELGGHPLALTLLGTYLRDICDRDVYQRRAVPLVDEESEAGWQAKRILTAYATWFGDGPERRVLRLLGLFDRPAAPQEIAALRAAPVIPGLTEGIDALNETAWRKALARLRRARLLADAGGAETLEAHPLVRAYFGQELENQGQGGAWRQGNVRLFEHLSGSVPEQPDTLEEMQALYSAVIHGCRAGLHQEALDQVYWLRILRGVRHFSWKKLGAFGSELTALAGFFDRLWDRPLSGLSPADQAFVLNEAGFVLRALGRPLEAVQPLEASLEICIHHGDWINASIRAGNLGELYTLLGDLPRAAKFGEQSVELADRGGLARDLASMIRIDVLRMAIEHRTSLACTLYRMGRWKESAALIREAEARQARETPKNPSLQGIAGHLHCELLCDQLLASRDEKSREFQRACREMLERARALFESPAERQSLLHSALDHLTLGQILGIVLTSPEGGRAELPWAAEHLNRAIEILRQAGDDAVLPRGLLVRAAFRRLASNLDGAAADVTEAWEIAERGSMRLHECDALLEWTRLLLQQGRKEDARQHLAQAQEIIAATGYERRAREVEHLARAIG